MIKKMEQILVETGELFTTASGISMLPCIRPKLDMIHIVTPNKIVNKRKNGNYILHRVMKTKPDGYVLCGDNQWVLERGIKDEQVLGVLKGFYRGERYVDCEKNRLYHIYVAIWCFSLAMRKWILKGMNLMRRTGRILRKFPEKSE